MPKQRDAQDGRAIVVRKLHAPDGSSVADAEGLERVLNSQISDLIANGYCDVRLISVVGGPVAMPMESVLPVPAVRRGPVVPDFGLGSRPTQIQVAIMPVIMFAIFEVSGQKTLSTPMTVVTRTSRRTRQLQDLQASRGVRQYQPG